jgi:alkanesulfonate monooxygenase SsuD/methylene tetrahydromethanopterin reductase-like flavin-dependent oxidoreductase (luciferase family)
VAPELELTGGRAIFALGAGEMKQLSPFGYEERRPFTRLEESIRTIRDLWSRDEPFSFDGRTMQVTKAHLGTRATDGTTPPIFAAMRRLGADILSWMDWCAFADPTQRWDSTDRSVRAKWLAEAELAQDA